MAYLNGKKVLLPIQLHEGGGLSTEAKNALLNLLEHVAYTDENGQTYLNALRAALFPPANLVSIAAIFEQGQNVIKENANLDELKQYLTVTATYSDETTATVTDYTLSGTLTAGTSTITVLYGGKTDTFDVVVSAGTSDMDGWTDGVAYQNLTIVQNSYVKAANGSFASYSGWDRTGYVPCENASTIEFPPYTNARPADSGSNAFYDTNKHFISSFDVGNSARTTVTVPSNACYFAISTVTGVLQQCIADGIIPNA